MVKSTDSFIPVLHFQGVIYITGQMLVMLFETFQEGAEIFWYWSWCKNLLLTHKLSQDLLPFRGICIWVMNGVQWSPVPVENKVHRVPSLSFQWGMHPSLDHSSDFCLLSAGPAKPIPNLDPCISSLNPSNLLRSYPSDPASLQGPVFWTVTSIIFTCHNEALAWKKGSHSSALTRSVTVYRSKTCTITKQCRIAQHESRSLNSCLLSFGLLFPLIA